MYKPQRLQFLNNKNVALAYGKIILDETELAPQFQKLRNAFFMKLFIERLQSLFQKT